MPLLLLPAHLPERWDASGIEQDLADLPDILTWQDKGGSEARRFGVATSGHVLLYDAQGRLTYSGGITSARATGATTTAVMRCWPRSWARKADRPGNPVFGCPLATPQPPVMEESP